MDAEEQEEATSIEHYLQTLRKKVQHQIKNPFELPFAAYTFDQLLNWKNNILQLDTTSRLYAQRVDFLHNGTLRILTSFITNQPPAETQPQIDITPSAIPETNIFEKYLESPDKIDNEVKTHRINELLWREIMKKRDTLPLLMLNTLNLNPKLELPLTHESHSNNAFYEPIFADQRSLYLRLIDFSALNTDSLAFFALSQSVISELNRDLILIKTDRNQRPREFITSDWDTLFIEFQTNFNTFSQAQHNTEPQFFIQNQNQLDLELPPDNMHQNTIEFIEDDSQSQNNFSIYTISDPGDTAKTRATRKTTAARKKRQVQKLQIFFHGIFPNRSQSLLLPKTEEQPNYLQSKDHLLLKFIKYCPPFRKNRRIPQTAKPQISCNGPISYNEPETNFSYFQTGENSEFRVQPVCTGLSLGGGVSQFKEAVLMIKQMKQLIKSNLEPNQNITFFKLAEKLNQQEPLDIFITALHIAAQEGTIMTR